MLSVVVPAVWGYDPFCDFLQYVVELPVVGEVIIINNNISRTPHHPVLDHPKVKHHKMDQNIFVNPAWNLGVKLSTYEKICILSDDVSVDLRVFFEADKFISKDIGLLSIGTSLGIYNLHMKRYEEIKNINDLVIRGDIKIKKYYETPEVCGGGSLFFIHKNNWIDIPEQLKIYFGDTWQFDMQIQMDRINYILTDCFYYTPWSGAIKIGVGRDYQETEEYGKNENHESFKLLKEQYLEKKIYDKTAVQKQWDIIFDEMTIK